MLLQINNIRLDTSQVGGTYDETRKGFVQLEKPRVVLHFIRQIVQDLVRPRAGRPCGISCRDVTTIVLGQPFHQDLETVAPT